MEIILRVIVVFVTGQWPGLIDPYWLGIAVGAAVGGFFFGSVFYHVGCYQTSNRVNRQWIENEEWKHITATPWGAWMKHKAQPHD